MDLTTGVAGADTIDLLGNPPVRPHLMEELPGPGPPAAPERPGRPERRSGPVVRRLLLFLGIGMAGVVVMFVGLAWDALVHARDPAAAHAASRVFHLGRPANPTLTEHYANVAYTQDGRVLDPNRPEALMYTPTSKGMVLVGVMYMMNVPGEFGPEPGGCLTRWHVHANVCFSAATFAPTSQLDEPGETCPGGEFRYIPPPALHVWFVDVPGGRFAPEVDAQYLAKKLGP